MSDILRKESRLSDSTILHYYKIVRSYTYQEIIARHQINKIKSPPVWFLALLVDGAAAAQETVGRLRGQVLGADRREKGRSARLLPFPLLLLSSFLLAFFLLLLVLLLVLLLELLLPLLLLAGSIGGGF